MTLLNVRRQGGFAFMILLAVLMSAPAFAQGGRGQGGPGGRGGEGGGRDGGRQRFENMTEEQREAMMEQFRERMAEREAEQNERLREEIGASEEEFEVLQPKIARLQQLTRERQMAGAGALGFGDRRGGQARGRGGFAGLIETSEEGEALTASQAELREVLEDDAVAGDIKDALAAYREARDAMDEAIAEAREDLRGLLTARQEAYFVVNGMLD